MDSHCETQAFTDTHRHRQTQTFASVDSNRNMQKSDYDTISHQCATNQVAPNIAHHQYRATQPNNP
jgi:hypothetical protein